MASIFISHSSRDSEPTVQIEAWLRKLAYDDIFLDIHKNDGISPGMNWKGELAAAMKRSQIVLLLVSDNWFASVWCQAEYATAIMTGKQIVPVLISPSREGDWEQLRQALQGKLGDIQFADLIRDWHDGLARLEVVLDRSRVTPLAFDVPPGAAPYKGLSPYTANEAGLFFARERETQEILEQLRQLAGAARADRLLVILGASGAGKSSLLRAGLWPQLSLRPREWLPLEPMIPQQNTFLGVTPILALARAIADTFARYASPRSPADVVRHLESEQPGEAFSELAGELRTLSGGLNATLVLGIDQAEELLRTDAAEQTRFIELLRCFLGLPGCVAVLTIRSDTFDALQERRLLENVPFAVYSVAPMPLARIPEVIRGPASRVGLRVHDALVDQATEDAKTGDALPLLSFTLERLWRDHGREGDLNAAAYEKLASKEHGVRVSPVENTVRLAAEEVVGRLGAADANALAEGFVPGLVDLTDGLEPVRRRASWASMPERAVPILKKLQEARLLTSGSTGEGREADNTIEVAHEALLRRWPMLVERIEAAKPDLRLLQEVERAAADWMRLRAANPRDARKELRHDGKRLARARTLAERKGWRERLGQTGVAYLDACVHARRRRVGLIGGAATFLLCSAAVVWAYRESDAFAVCQMLRNSPDAQVGYQLAPGRAFVLARAGLGDLAREEIKLLPGDKQGSELCQTGLRLLDAGKKDEAKNFISLVLTPELTYGRAALTDCLAAAFLVGLGDKAGAVRKASDNAQTASLGKCDALVSALSSSAARVLPEPKYTVQQLEQSLKDSECDALLGEYKIVLPREVRPPGWLDYFSSLRMTQRLLSAHYVGGEAKRRIYWKMIEKLSLDSDSLPDLERLIRERGKYLQVARLSDKEALNKPLLATLVRDSASGPFPESAGDEAIFHGLDTGACVQVWTGLGRAYRGSASAARDGIARAKRMIREAKAKETGVYFEPSDYWECVVAAFTAIRDYDTAESITAHRLDVKERDNLFRDIAVQQAGHREFKRARETSGKISTIAGQQRAETEVLMIWSEAQAGS